MTWRAHDVRWASAALRDVPDGDAWLGPRERALLAQLRAPARRESFRLGRFTAKCLLGDVEILRAPDGSPEAFHGEERLAVSVSLSHRAGRAVCAAVAGGAAIGCDIERIEPRSPAFLQDFLTRRERASVAQARDPAQCANLIWSAKESALKALHVGLNRDTYELEVRFAQDDPGPPAEHDLERFRELSVYDRASGTTLCGQWRRFAEYVVTMIYSSDMAAAAEPTVADAAQGPNAAAPLESLGAPSPPRHSRIAPPHLE